MAFPIQGVALRSLHEIALEIANFAQDFRVLRSVLENLLEEAQTNNRNRFDNAALVNEWGTGRRKTKEASLREQVEKHEKTYCGVMMKVEKWLQISFDKDTSQRLLEQFNPKSQIFAVGGSAASAIRDLRTRIDRRLEFMNALEHNLDTYDVHQNSDVPRADSAPGSVRDAILIFVALDEEYEFLKEHWNLKHKMGDLVATGTRGLLDVHVITPRKAGRVPAAVTMTRLLATTPTAVEYRMIFVLGIAGGFSEEDVKVGDVVIARKVVDLASRKIRSDADQIAVEFRQETYDTHSVLETFCKSDLFDESAWAEKRASHLYWPDKSRRPNIKIGALSSMDEVVSSDKWRQDLLRAWPKLLGVEMEAGGICESLKSLGLRPPCVLRGISDNADPMKSDNSWRAVSMENITSILDAFLDEWEEVRKHL